MTGQHKTGQDKPRVPAVPAQNSECPLCDNMPCPPTLSTAEPHGCPTLGDNGLSVRSEAMARTKADDAPPPTSARHERGDEASESKAHGRRTQGHDAGRSERSRGRAANAPLSPSSQAAPRWSPPLGHARVARPPCLDRAKRLGRGPSAIRWRGPTCCLTKGPSPWQQAAYPTMSLGNLDHCSQELRTAPRHQFKASYKLDTRSRKSRRADHASRSCDMLRIRRKPTNTSEFGEQAEENVRPHTANI